eukprot:7293634-Pyramimonas_sp.AAC.1
MTYSSPVSIWANSSRSRWNSSERIAHRSIQALHKISSERHWAGRPRDLRWCMAVGGKEY